MIYSVKMIGSEYFSYLTVFFCVSKHVTKFNVIFTFITYKSHSDFVVLNGTAVSNLKLNY